MLKSDPHAWPAFFLARRAVARVTPDTVVALSEELTNAGADWQIHGYGNTYHAFTNPEANAPDMGAMYDANAGQRSWVAMSNFVGEVLA